ncbi:HAMP domain-containing sensor histidine kinase [Granulicella sp. L60]|uniref:sensor histidine kinase n=1 Tax=Granulicella sp. L60 TaxID=1641866 RepID=UPI00131E27F6|nr:ATP-binding protein [Granulicella sp. L60]
MWHTNNFWLLILSSGLFSYVLTSYVVGPVTSLSRVAAQFGAGDLKARAASPLLRRKDEFGELGKVFNHMASKIEVLISRYKSFLAHASHELGSPLTRLNIALALAKRKAGPQLQPELDRIGQEADRINNLVHELLLLARLESDNELSRTPVSFDVGALVEEIRAEAMLEAKQIMKTVHLDRQESFGVRGYPELLRRAIENVLRNALRFAREQGTVQISYFQKSNLAVGVILIEDDGPGVPLGKEQAIFEPFLTLPSENSENGSGSGLGLAIAKQAVLVNGGTIFAYSLTDRGLAVSIELPIEVMTQASA